MAQAEQLTSLEHVALARLEGLVVADAADEDAAPALVSELCLVSYLMHAAAISLNVLDRSLKLGTQCSHGRPLAQVCQQMPTYLPLSPWTTHRLKRGIPVLQPGGTFAHATAKPALGPAPLATCCSGELGQGRQYLPLGCLYIPAGMNLLLQTCPKPLWQCLPLAPLIALDSSPEGPGYKEVCPRLQRALTLRARFPAGCFARLSEWSAAQARGIPVNPIC